MKESGVVDVEAQAVDSKAYNVNDLKTKKKKSFCQRWLHNRMLVSGGGVANTIM
jgi:hypothetical protein